jgi:two-component system, OmpR family, phosphate regulon sensor histidine kinase PhoR
MQQEHDVDMKVLNEDLENYFANTIIPQLFVDAELVLRKFTPPAMKQFSLSPQDVGRPILEVQDNIRYPTLLENISEVIDTGKILEKEVQTTDKRWFQMNILPYIVRRTNMANGVIITFVDITRRLNLLKELEKLNADHQTLMYALSHDIRQPLSTILLLTEELAQGTSTHEPKQLDKWMQLLKKSSLSMKELVNDFTEHIRVRDQSTPADERLHIAQIFEDVREALREEIIENQVIIDSAFDPGEIQFPRNNLRSIVYNLLGNAIKYKKPDAPLHIRISTTREEDVVILTVSDDGIGIAAENQRSVFDKYVRLDHAIEGTGMGLYIVRRMLEARGDRVELESEPGKGTTLRVYLHDKG